MLGTQYLKLIACKILTPSCLKRTCESCPKFEIKVPDEIKFKSIFSHEWLAEVREREGAKKKLFKVNITIKKTFETTVSELVERFSSKISKFLQYIYLVTYQHISFRNIKSDLDFNEAALAFDSFTNDLGNSREGIQSSNYGASKTQISLQTGIIYYRDNSSNLMKHASFGTICDFFQHDAATAWAYLEPAFEYLMESGPDLEILHLLLDGSTSQYENKRYMYLFRHFCKKLQSKELL